MGWTSKYNTRTRILKQAVLIKKQEGEEILDDHENDGHSGAGTDHCTNALSEEENILWWGSVFFRNITSIAVLKG